MGLCDLALNHADVVYDIGLKVKALQDAQMFDADLSDVDNDNLTYSINTNPSNGTIAFTGNSTIAYNPNSGFSGSDSFTYSVNDGSLDSNVDFIFQKFDWPTKGIISGVFGSQRILNGKPKRPHYGVDIAASEGTDILAPTEAIVRMAEKDLYYTGGTVMLDHGHGVTSVYSHLSSINVNVGDKINKDQKIGEVGSTGRSTGPHLDWRINWFSERLDPALFIKK